MSATATRSTTAIPAGTAGELAPPPPFDIASMLPALAVDAEGIWRARDVAPVSYPDEGHAHCLAVEDGSFWFRHRNRCIVACVRRWAPASGRPFIDVGAGNGYVSRGLADAGFEVVAIEPGAEGARNARRRGLKHVVCATSASSGLVPHAASAVGVFDVVEHVADDVGFVAGLRPLVETGGRLFLTVPAYRALWSGEDVATGHHRRYTRESIAATLASAGWQVEYSTYFFRWLVLPIFLMRALPHRLGLRRSTDVASNVSREHAATSPALVSAIEKILAAEVALIESGRSMAFGGSLLVVAR